MSKSPYIDKLEELTNKLPDIPIYMHHMFSQSQDMMVVVDAKGNFTWVNKYTETLLGYSRDEIYKIAFENLVHPDDFNATVNIYHDLLNIDGFNISNFSNRYLSKSGVIIPLCWNTTALIDGFAYCIGRQCHLSTIFNECHKKNNCR